VIKEDWKSLQIEDSPRSWWSFNDYDMSVYKDGKWKQGQLWSVHLIIYMDLESYSEAVLAPMMLEEMRSFQIYIPGKRYRFLCAASIRWWIGDHAGNNGRHETLAEGCYQAHGKVDALGAE
jgi:hypothetical protein